METFTVYIYLASVREPVEVIVEADSLKKVEQYIDYGTEYFLLRTSTAYFKALSKNVAGYLITAS